MISVEAGQFPPEDGDHNDGRHDEMVGATFSGTEGELFTVLVDPKPGEYLVQIDTPGKGRGLEVIEARPGYLLLSVPRVDSGALAEVRPFPPRRAS